MKPANARLLDDFIAGERRPEVYRLVRDAHVTDVSEILFGLEQRLDDDRAREALVHFAWMLIETRAPHGSETARRRDELAAHYLLCQPTTDRKKAIGVVPTGICHRASPTAKTR